MRNPSPQKIAWILLAAACSAALAQQPADTKAAPDTKAVADRRTQATTLRDSFVAATAAAGMGCPGPPPSIVVENVPAYGSYDPQTNTLKTSAWQQLDDEQKGRFFRMLGPNATEDAARAEFEIGANDWVFTRELEGWWQTCRKLPETPSPYAYESGINRIAAAYWREHDPSILTHQRKVFEYLESRVPTPVPAGQSVEAYYDAHYPNKFKSAPEYLWFQARMCLALFDEKPSPTFAQALKDVSPKK